MKPFPVKSNVSVEAGLTVSSLTWTTGVSGAEAAAAVDALDKKSVPRRVTCNALQTTKQMKLTVKENP